MRIKFRILKMKHPKTYDEWKDYIIADVLVMECSKDGLVGKEYVFKGYLPSCAPYFVFTAENGVSDTSGGKSYKNEFLLTASDKVKFTYERRLTVEGVMYMLIHEVPRANNELIRLGRFDKCQKYTIEQSQKMVEQWIKNGDLWFMKDKILCDKLLRKLSVFREEVLDKIDYFRLDYVRPIMDLYTGVADSKTSRTLESMPGESLVRLKTLIDGDPIQMCFRKEISANYKLKPLGYAPLRVALLEHNRTVSPENKYAEFKLCGVRILQFYRDVIVEKENHTCCEYDQFKTRYLNYKSGYNRSDARFFDQALWWLVKENELIYLKPLMTCHQGDKNTQIITDIKCNKRATDIVNLIGKTIERSKTKKVDDILRFKQCAWGHVLKLPCWPPKHLTDEQTTAALHMLNNPITIIMGPPGRGKTSMIEFAMTFMEKIAVTSFVGTNVASHRIRMNGRQESSNTTHHVYYSARKSEPGKEWAESFEGWVCDEFSNVSDSLFAHALNALTRISRLVPIVDPHQIQSLKPGCPALDMIDYFKDQAFPLTINLRTNPRARILADAAIHIVRGESTKIEWSHDMKELESMTIVNPGARLSHEQHDEVNLMRMIREIFEHVQKHEKEYGVQTILDIQFVTFKKKMRETINKIVEDMAIRTGLIKATNEERFEVRTNLLLYKGAKICFRENFPQVFQKDSNTKRYRRAYDAVRNGEVGIVSSVVKNDDGSHVVTFSHGGCLKRILLNKKLHVDPNKVFYGHCITCNASQGSEYNCVVGVFHDGAVSESWISRAHVYVLSSRAKNAFLCCINSLDPEAVFNTVCLRLEPRRSSLLRYLLQQSNLSDIQKSREITTLPDLSKCVLESTDIPCVPTLEHFVASHEEAKKARKKIKLHPY
jgi:hypothetical protein